MNHLILKRPLRDYYDEQAFSETLDAYTTKGGYKVLNCGITDGGRLAWAILQKEEAHE